MAVTKLYEVGMRTAPERHRDLKGEVAGYSATRNTGTGFHFAAAGISFATDLHAGAAGSFAVKIHSLPYSKQKPIPNNESSSLSAIQLAGFNSARLAKVSQGPGVVP